MKKSEDKTCAGNGLLNIWGLVIVYAIMPGGGGYTVTSKEKGVG